MEAAKVTKVKRNFVLTTRKTTVVILIVSLLCSVFGIAGYTYAQSGIGNQNYPTGYNSGGPQPGAPTYTIFTFTNNTGVFYAAKDQYGRLLDSWTSNDATVTWNAITSAATGANHFMFSSGHFILTTDAFLLLNNNGSTISGQGESTWIDASGSANNTFIGLNQQGLTFKNMRITGNGVTSTIHGIDLRSCSNSTVENVLVDNYGDGVKFGGTGSGNKVLNSRFVNITDSGVELEGAQSDTTISDNFFDRCNKGVLAQYAPEVSSAGWDNTIEDNTIINCDRGIWLDEGQKNFTIQNNRINGLGAASPLYGISVSNGTTDVTIQGNTIKGYIASIATFADTGGVACGNLTIQSNTLTNATQNGFYATSGSNLFIRANTVYMNGRTGIYVSGCSNGTIANNDVYGNGWNAAASYNGIELAASTFFFVQNNHCYDTNNPATIQRVGIRLTGASNNNYVYNNDVRGNAWAGNNINTVAGNYFEGNIGWLTENSGSSTGTGAQQTIPHGLAGPPTIVILSNGDAASNPYQSAAADATNIYVTADTGETWYWQAISKP